MNEKRNQIPDLYAKRAQKLDVVQEVRYSEDEDGILIWTVISALPFEDALRDPIYEAQMEVLKMTNIPCVSFRVINTEELSDGDVFRVVPDDSKLVWKREHAQRR